MTILSEGGSTRHLSQLGECTVQDPSTLSHAVLPKSSVDVEALAAFVSQVWCNLHMNIREAANGGFSKDGREAYILHRFRNPENPFWWSFESTPVCMMWALNDCV